MRQNRNVFLQSEVLFSSANFEGTLIFPTTVCKGRNVKAMIKIKKLSDQDVKLSYRGVLDIPSFSSSEGTEQIDVEIDDVDLRKDCVYIRDLWINVQDHGGIDSNIILRSGSATAF